MAKDSGLKKTLFPDIEKQQKEAACRRNYFYFAVVEKITSS